MKYRTQLCNLITKTKRVGGWVFGVTEFCGFVVNKTQTMHHLLPKTHKKLITRKLNIISSSQSVSRLNDSLCTLPAGIKRHAINL